MSLKAKLISTISAFVLILTIVIVAVWAATQANVSLGGTVNFQATNVYAKVTGTVTGMDSNPTLPTLIFSEGKDASEEPEIEQWNNLNLVFNTSGTPIEIEVTVENLSDERSLGVSIQNQIASIENIDISITSEGEASTSATLSPSTGSGTSTVTFLVTVSLQNPNVSVTDAIYDILIKLTDESQMKQINVYSNDPSLGTVSGGGLYAAGSTATLSASPEDGKTFIAWASSTNPEEMEILSVSQTFSFEVSDDSANAIYALFNETTASLTEGEYTYTLYNEAKLAEVSGVQDNKSIASATISQFVQNNSFKVFSIGNLAFVSCTNLNQIEIPEGIAIIKLRAFFDCISLTNLTLPSSIKSIELSAFQNCNQLQEVTILGNIESLDEYAFVGTTVEKLTIDGGVTKLPEGLFEANNFTSLSEIVVEAGSTLTAELPSYETWTKNGGDEPQTNFSGEGTYTRPVVVKSYHATLYTTDAGGTTELDAEVNIYTDMTAELKYTINGYDGTSTVTLKGEYTKFDNFGYISNPTYLSTNEGGEVMEWKEGDSEDSELYTMAVFIAEGVWIFDNFVYYAEASGFADDYTPSGTDQIIGGTFGVIRGLTGNETISELFGAGGQGAMTFLDRYESGNSSVQANFVSAGNYTVISLDGEAATDQTTVSLGYHTLEISFQLNGETVTATVSFVSSSEPEIHL